MIYMIKDFYDDMKNYDMSFIGIESDTIKDYLFFNHSLKKFVIPVFWDGTNVGYLEKRWDIFKKNRASDFENIKNALTAVYNPIENYDRKEKSTTTNSGNDVVKNVGKTDDIKYNTTDRVEGTTDSIEYNTNDVETKDLTTKYDNTDTKNGKETNTDVKEKSGFNSPNSTFVAEKDTVTTEFVNSQIASDATTKDTGTDSYKKTGTDTHTADYSNTKSGSETHSSDMTNTTEHGHIVEFENETHGNIGVTTSQQMIESELDLRLKNNLVEMIVKSFLSDFTFY